MPPAQPVRLSKRASMGRTKRAPSGPQCASKGTRALDQGGRATAQLVVDQFDMWVHEVCHHGADAHILPLLCERGENSLRGRLPG